MNRSSLRNLLACTLAVAAGGLFDAAADDILVYRVSASRRFQQNEAFFPGQASQQLRNNVVGTFRDSMYIVFNRDTNEWVEVNFFRSVVDGARLSQYVITRRNVLPWDSSGAFPADDSIEFLSVLAPGTNNFSLSFKEHLSADLSGDFNGDGPSDEIREGYLSFYTGVGGTRNVRINNVNTPVAQVPARLTGRKREFSASEFGPVGSNPYSVRYYRASAPQTATFDSRLTGEARAASSRSLTPVTSASVAAGSTPADSFTSNGHGLTTGETVIFESGTNFPDLTAAQTYYVIRLNQNRFRLAESLDNAKNNVFIDVTANGTVGVFTVTPTTKAIEAVEAVLQKMNFDNANPPDTL